MALKSIELRMNLLAEIIVEINSVQNKFQFLCCYFIHHGAIINKLIRLCFTWIYVVIKVSEN